MNNNSTIKWRFIWAYVWMIGVVYLITYIAEDQLFDTHYSAWVFGLFQFFLGIYYFLKTRVWQYLAGGIVLGTGYWHYEAAEHMDTIFSMLTVYIHLVTLFIVMFIAGPGINKALRLEINARKLFRLAAEPVRETENGFTDRPYSAGEMDYTLNDIIGLGRFLSGKDILLYHSSPEAVTFSFSMNVSPLVDKDFRHTSTITFSNKGNLSVRISGRDYNQYRKKLSFDHLCESFARIFRQYVEAYQKNNENRIIHELKSA